MTDNQQTIMRSPHDKENPYAQILRVSLQDKSLSYEARGLLGDLLSRPGDWRVNLKELEIPGCGRDKVRRIIKELVSAKYLVSPKRVPTTKGHWGWTPYMVFERPAISDVLKSRQSENPTVGKGVDIQKKDTTEKRTEQTLTLFESVSSLSSLGIEPKDSATVVAASEIPKKERAVNAWYDAIETTWHYTGQMNGAMQKMLQGKATAPAWKSGNLKVVITPEALLEWAKWYRKVELHGDKSLNMLEDREKIASSIQYWVEHLMPTDSKPRVDQLLADMSGEERTWWEARIARGLPGPDKTPWAYVDQFSGHDPMWDYAGPRNGSGS